MPAPIDEIVKRRVIQQWLSGESRDKIAIDNNIGSGTVSSIVNNYKIGLDNLDLDSFRGLMVEVKKRSMTPNDLASYFRLYNYFRSSGAAVEDIESFIVNIGGSNLPHEKVIQYVNQLYEVSKEESIPPHEVPNYIKEKFEEKQKIDEDIKAADTVLQSKNMSIQAINEHLQLNEKLKEHGLSTQDIDKLLNLLLNAKKYGFGGKEIAEKLYNIQELECKEKELKDKRKKLSKRISKYKDVVPLTEDIAALGIGIDELIALKVGINQAAEAYGFTPSAAALHVINVIRDYKRGQLKHELYELNLQKYAISQFCSGHRDAMMALTNLPHMTHVGLDKHLKEQPSDKEITTYEQINANISNKMLENNEKITCGDM
ncbi:MAG: hypothetical protein ACJ72Q_04035 [Nitrososphaeraceae archaeon]